MCTCLSRVLHSSLAALRCLSTAAAGPPEASDHVQRQILQAGLHYLKGDTEKLKENVTHRAGTADVDKLVNLQLQVIPNESFIQNTDSPSFRFLCKRSTTSCSTEQTTSAMKET